jgi:hypothetical protein
MKSLSYNELCITVIRWEGYTFEIVNKKTREREICFTRQLCMYLGLLSIRKLTLAQAGHYFGKDHATALHAKKTIQNLIDTDLKVRQKVSEYISKINGESAIKLPLQYEIMKIPTFLYKRRKNITLVPCNSKNKY